MTPFDPASATCFTFERCRCDPATGQVELAYGLGDWHFSERLSFPDIRNPEAVDRRALESALSLAHWLAGVSYFKAALPAAVAFASAAPAPRCAGLLGEVYRQGLAEMVYRNDLKLPAADLFQAAASSPAASAGPPPVVTGRGVVVPLGGGKDSLLTCSLLHEAGIPYRTIAVGQSALIQHMGARLLDQGLSTGHLQISRTLDPKLLALNQAGAYNGHVPITGVLAGVLLLAGVLYGFDTVVMSNERSADAANLTLPDGELVNHQYSKSAGFEASFQRAVDSEVLRGFRYFSLLRGSSEVAIARRFAGLTQWHAHFSSCNRNFHLDGAALGGRWCCVCAKCRFVFLSLAPHMAPAALRRIFGRQLLDDPAQVSGFRALCGLEGHKPFECVGEVEESAALIKALGAQPAWRDCAVVAALAPELAGAPELSSFYPNQPVTSVPEEFRPALPERLGVS